MLVQNGFADPGAFGDLVHPGGVEAAVDKNIAGSDEQLAPTLVTRQPVAAPGSGAGLHPAPAGGIGEFAHPFLNLLVIARVLRARSRSQRHYYPQAFSIVTYALNVGMSTSCEHLRARRESQLAAVVPSWESDLRPRPARGQPDTGSSRRLARTAARPTGPAGVGRRRAGPVEPGHQPFPETELAGTLRVDLRLARVRAAGIGSRYRGGAVPDRRRHQRVRARLRAADSGPAENR